MSVAGPALARLLAGRAAAWVAGQRARHRPRASPLTPAARERLGPWFRPDTLVLARVRTVPRLDPGPVIGALERVGFRPPLEWDRIWGITFVDTIVLMDRVPAEELDTLLFHECVHVAQYRLLGARRFLDEYLRGWVEAGRRYRDIPLEADAYALALKFATAPDAPFAVEPEVAARLHARGWAAG